MKLIDLKRPFPPEKISWRVGSMTQDKKSGMALAYIDSRDVQDRLDEVCGVEGWQCSYPHANGKTVCSIGIKVGDEWIWKADGAGDSDIEAEKGALSDSFKRAAVKWGVGRYLYDLDSPWVQLDDRKRIVSSEYKKLEAMLGKSASAAPKQAQPAAPPDPYESDPDGQTKAWRDRQIQAMQKCMTLPPLYGWLAQVAGDDGTITDPGTGSPLDRLKRKSPEIYGDIVQAFNAQLRTINSKENA